MERSGSSIALLGILTEGTREKAGSGVNAGTGIGAFSQRVI